MPIHRNTRHKAGGDEHQISFLPQAPASTTRGPHDAFDAAGTDSAKNNRGALLSRRGFLYGAAAVGAVAVGAAGVAAMGQPDEETEEVVTLEVPENRVFTQEDCTEMDAGAIFKLVADFTLPFGALVWANDAAVAACLLPTDTPSPLTQMALLNLATGDYAVMLEAAVGSDEGFEVYDVRATSAGMVWTEANVFEGRWRVYAAALDESYALGQPQLLQEGLHDTETPSIAAVGESAYWQVMPHIDSDEARTGSFQVKQARFGSEAGQVVHESVGRAIAPLYACSDGVVACPRIATGERYWELVHLQESTREVAQRQVLPGGMQPSAVAWGSTGFAFCFDSIYDFGEGISNLGTYTPASTHDDLSEAMWFRFGRTPFASPAWCGQQWLLVKSTQAVCAIDVQARTYCALAVDDGSDDWGDYLATSGTHPSFVTYAHLDSTDASGEKTHRTQVRVWEPYTDEERAGLEAQAFEQAQAEQAQDA